MTVLSICWGAALRCLGTPSCKFMFSCSRSGQNSGREMGIAREMSEEKEAEAVDRDAVWM